MTTTKPVVKPVLYTSKTLADGKHPIMIRLTQSKKIKYYSTGFSLLKSSWNKTNKEPNREGNKLYPNLSGIIKEEILKAENIIQDYLKEQKHHIHIDDLFAALTGGNEKNDSLKITSVLPLFDNVINDLKSQGRIKNANVFSDTKRVFNHYIEQNKNGKDIKLSNVDLNILESWETFMNSSFFKNRKGGKGLSVSTKSVYLRTFRTLINKAIKMKLIDKDKYPFEDFKMGKYTNIRTKKRAITEEHLDSIKSYKTSNKDLQFAKDMYLFSYYCAGMNFRDMAYLTESNLIKGRIEYERSKTKKRDSDGNSIEDIKPISIKIIPEIQKILDKYAVPDSPFLFPILCARHDIPITLANKKNVMTMLNNRIEKINKVVNKNVKSIAIETGIISKDEPFTFYSARHTAATMLRNKGIPIPQIQQALGHDNVMQTSTYLASLGHDVMDTALSVL